MDKWTIGKKGMYNNNLADRTKYKSQQNRYLKNPNLTYEEIKEIIIKSADDSIPVKQRGEIRTKAPPW